MAKEYNKIIGNSVVFLTVISYFGLFQLTVIPNIIRQTMPLFAVGLMLLLILLKVIYHPENKLKMNFWKPVLLLIIGVIPSFFIARSYHDQNFMISMFANRFILFYLLYFFVHLFNISVRYILRLIIIVGLIAVVLYYIQFFIYPARIMNINLLEGRGTIRLFVPGMICTQVAYFYFLNQFFANNKPVNLLFSLLTLSIFILQGTRQLIFAMVFLTLVNLLLSNRVKAKLLISIVVSLASVALFLIFREIFVQLTQVSTSQAKEFGEGIRIKSATFYLTTFMPGSLAYVFGNGVAALGSWYDQKMSLYSFQYGFYLSDIGIIGDYVRYGIVFTVAGIALLIKAITFRVSPYLKYLKYYIVVQCFTLFTGYGILGGVDINLLLILFIFDADRAEILDKLVQKNETEIPPIE